MDAVEVCAGRALVGVVLDGGVVDERVAAAVGRFDPARGGVDAGRVGYVELARGGTDVLCRGFALGEVARAEDDVEPVIACQLAADLPAEAAIASCDQRDGHLPTGRPGRSRADCPR